MIVWPCVTIKVVVEQKPKSENTTQTKQQDKINH